MLVEVTIKVLGDADETAEQLLGRIAAVLRNQPQILIEDTAGKAAQKEKAKADEGEKPTQKKRGRPAKKEEEPEELEKVDDEIEIEEDEESEDGDEADEDEKPAPKKKSSGSDLTIEGDIIPAFKAFTKAHGNGAGAEILQLFKVTSVRDLDDEDLPKVIKALKSYKKKK